MKPLTPILLIALFQPALADSFTHTATLSGTPATLSASYSAREAIFSAELLYGIGWSVPLQHNASLGTLLSIDWTASLTVVEQSRFAYMPWFGPQLPGRATERLTVTSFGIGGSDAPGGYLGGGGAVIPTLEDVLVPIGGSTAAGLSLGSTIWGSTTALLANEFYANALFRYTSRGVNASGSPLAVWVGMDVTWTLNYGTAITVIPEPGGLGLLAAGLVLVAALRKRQ